MGSHSASQLSTSPTPGQGCAGSLLGPPSLPEPGTLTPTWGGRCCPELDSGPSPLYTYSAEGGKGELKGTYS